MNTPVLAAAAQRLHSGWRSTPPRPAAGVGIPAVAAERECRADYGAALVTPVCRGSSPRLALPPLAARRACRGASALAAVTAATMAWTLLAPAPLLGVGASRSVLG
jgi:hypothetical protein